MRDETLVKITAIVSLTILGVTYFLVVRQDGTILGLLASFIGGIVGYEIGRRRSRNGE